jgi:hypothetical protein
MGWRLQREEIVRTRKESNQMRGTHLWRPQREGYIRAWKDSDRARGTDEPGTTEGGSYYSLHSGMHDAGIPILTGNGGAMDYLEKRAYSTLLVIIHPHFLLLSHQPLSHQSLSHP